MPGANPRALEKARQLAADVLILDLEDAVAPEVKSEARDRVVTAVDGRGYGAREVVVRINGLDTPWGHDDLAAVAEARPDALLLPKIESVAMLTEARTALTACGASELPIWAMIETPKALMALAELAEAAASTGLQAFVLGTNDLAKAQRAVPDEHRSCFAYALSVLVTAARAYDLIALDGVFNDIEDNHGLERECLQGLHYGFDGKTLIHPSQLSIANEVFAPTETELAWAEIVVEAFTQRENQGKGVIRVEGRMVELLHREQAQRTLDVQRAIEGLTQTPTD